MNLCTSWKSRRAQIPFFLFASYLGLAAFATPQEDTDKNVDFVIYGLDLEPIDMKLSKAPTRSKLKAIAKLTGTPLNALKRSGVFMGSVEANGDEKEAHIASVPFQLKGIQHHALLALNENGRFLRATILDEFGAPQEEWKQSLETFQHYAVPKMEAAHPRAYLKQVRALGSRPNADQESRLKVALLDVARHMQAQASIYNLPKKGRKLSPAQEQQMVATSYATLAAMTEALTPLLGEQSAEFKRLATLSAEAAERVAKALAAGSPASSTGVERVVLRNCKNCHSMSMPGSEESLRGVFTNARRERGIGNGYYQVGHDVRFTHNDRDQLQAVADALRSAALLIDIATGR